MNRARPVSKRKSSRAISPILATIILIVITVVVGVMLYGFVAGFFTSTATANSANLEASLVISPGASSGTFTLTVKNAGTTTITGIRVQVPNPSYSSGSKIPQCLVNASFKGLDVAPGQEVTITAYGTSLPTISTGQQGYGSSAYVNSSYVISGSSYNYIVTVTFANGASKTYTGSVTASSF